MMWKFYLQWFKFHYKAQADACAMNLFIILEKEPCAIIGIAAANKQQVVKSFFMG